MNEEKKVDAMEISEIKKTEQAKFSFLKNLFDLAGWKRDIKKILLSLLVILIVISGYFAVVRFSQGLLGIRFHMPIERVKYQTAVHKDPGFAFKYSEKYAYDGDEQKRYGKDYLGGFHLVNDSRTGCDVRRNDVGINFAKSEQEINAAVAKDLSQHVKGFEQFSGKKIKLGKTDAYTSNFLLTDPLGNAMHIDQTFVSSGGQDYLLVCGSSQAQYEFLKQDFQDFLDSFRFFN